MGKPFVDVKIDFEDRDPARKGKVQVGGRPPAVVPLSIGQARCTIKGAQVVLEQAGYAEFSLLRGGLETGFGLSRASDKGGIIFKPVIIDQITERETVSEQKRMEACILNGGCILFVESVQFLQVSLFWFSRSYHT